MKEADDTKNSDRVPELSSSEKENGSSTGLTGEVSLTQRIASSVPGDGFPDEMRSALETEEVLSRGPSSQGIEEYAFVWADEIVLEPAEPLESEDEKTSSVPQVNQLKEGNWRRSCTDTSDPNSCRIIQEVFLQRDVGGTMETLGRILKISISPFGNRDAQHSREIPYLTIHLPLGVDLRPGAVIRIDKRPEIPLPYLKCTADGCTVGRVLDNGLLQAMKEGRRIFVGFRPWGGTKPNIIPASLNGFATTFLRLQ